MLNPFPDLLVYVLLAPAILRVFLGIYFFSYGVSLFKKSHHTGGVTECDDQVSSEVNKEKPHARFSFGKYIEGISAIVGSLSVFIGLYTQIGALILIALSLFRVLKKDKRRVQYLLLFAMALSLLFSGAGALAFDFPL